MHSASGVGSGVGVDGGGVGAVWERLPLEDARRVPTMMTRQEVDYLHWLTGAWAAERRRGRVVELGCFLGGSTVALASGLARWSAADAGAGAGWGWGSVLTYDAFVMDEHAAEAFTTPYRAGENFRGLFESYTREFAGRVVVREGWLPESIDRDGERTLYPEQDAVGVLFIDAAKRWGVHTSVLRAFGRHVPEGGVIVQQDFKWEQYWIPVHMFQLRGSFAGWHDVPGATVSFRCVRPAGEDELAALLGERDTAPGEVHALWDRVEAWWGEQHAGGGRGDEHGAGGAFGGDFRMGLAVCRANHLAACGRWDDAASALERFAGGGDWAGVAGLGTARRGFAHALWTSGVGRLARRGAKHGRAAARLAELARVPVAGGGVVEVKGYPDRRPAWRAVTERARGMGARRVALFGGGQHAAEVIGWGWPWGELELVCVLDDHAHGRRIGGVEVLSAERMPAGIDAVITCSTRYEARLAESAARAAGEGVAVLTVYGTTGPGASRDAAVPSAA